MRYKAVIKKGNNRQSLLFPFYFSGSGPFVFFVCLDKVAKVIKAAAVSYLRYRGFCCSQLKGGMFDPMKVQIINRSAVCHTVEEAAEVFWGHVNGCRELFQSNRG